MKNLFYVENLSVGYYDKVILKDITFSVSKDCLTAILCPNNCGKTTLIKTLSGILRKKGGRVSVNNCSLSKRSFKKYILNIGVIFEDLNNQFICDRVIDEIRFPLINLAYRKKDIDFRVKRISKILAIDHLLDKEVFSLSILDKVKLLIAVSVVHLPKFLLVDDIFKFLKVKEQQEIFRIFRILNDEFGISIIFTTSLISSVIDADHIVVLGQGRKVMEGNFDSIIKQDNELAKLGLEIPIMIDLSRKLQFYNLVDTIYYDVDEVVNRLWK